MLMYDHKEIGYILIYIQYKVQMVVKEGEGQNGVQQIIENLKPHLNVTCTSKRKIKSFLVSSNKTESF